MARSLAEIRHDIMCGDLKQEDWFRLDKEVDEAFSIASEKEIQEFTDSGAGEMLYMVCSGFEHEHNKNG